jgi:hypothetical protein
MASKRRRFVCRANPLLELRAHSAWPSRRMSRKNWEYVLHRLRRRAACTAFCGACPAQRSSGELFLGANLMQRKQASFDNLSGNAAPQRYRTEFNPLKMLLRLSPRHESQVQLWKGS